MSNNSVQFLFVTVPTPDGRTAVFNALDVVRIEPYDENRAGIVFRGESSRTAPLLVALTPAEAAAATEQAMIGLSERMLTAAAQMARNARF